MNRLYKFFLLVALTCVVGNTAMAQTTIIKEITDEYLEKLINTAIANYPRVKSMESKVQIADANVKKAKLSYLDAFTLSYVYQPNNNINLYPVDNTTTTANTNRQSFFTGAQFGVFFNLGAFLQKPVTVKTAKLDREVAGYDQDEYLLTLKTNIKKRYYTYVQRLAALKLAASSANDAENLLKDSRYKFEKGEETLDNFTRARVYNTQQADFRITAEANLFQAKADLEELLGDKLENIK